MVIAMVRVKVKVEVVEADTKVPGMDEVNMRQENTSFPEIEASS